MLTITFYKKCSNKCFLAKLVHNTLINLKQIKQKRIEEMSFSGDLTFSLTTMYKWVHENVSPFCDESSCNRKTYIVTMINNWLVLMRETKPKSTYWVRYVNWAIWWENWILRCKVKKGTEKHNLQYNNVTRFTQCTESWEGFCLHSADKLERSQATCLCK